MLFVVENEVVRRLVVGCAFQTHTWDEGIDDSGIVHIQDVDVVRTHRLHHGSSLKVGAYRILHQEIPLLKKVDHSRVEVLHLVLLCSDCKALVDERNVALDYIRGMLVAENQELLGLAHLTYRITNEIKLTGIYRICPAMEKH